MKRDAQERQEQRKVPRFPLTGFLPGELLDESDKAFTYLLVDVSQGGLGLVTTRSPQSGAPMRIRFKPKLKRKGKTTLEEVVLTCVWVKELEGDPPSYRCGFVCQNQDTDLLAILRTISSIYIEE